MRHRQAALGHHLHQVSQAQLESKIPAHAQDDDFAVEVATLEQLLQALQLYHCRPSASSAASIADRIAPFAPEPSCSLSVNRMGEGFDDEAASAAQANDNIRPEGRAVAMKALFGREVAIG